MKIIVVGAGALGTIFAAHLSRAGHEVSVLVRGRRAEQVARTGLVVRGLVDLDIDCPIVTDPAAVPDAELLIVTVKSYDNEAAITALPPRRFDSVFSVANGVLKNAQLAACFGADRVLGCMANTSGELLDGGEVLFTRNVCVHLGELDGGLSARSRSIAETIDGCGINARPEESIITVEWSKFVGWTALVALSVTTRFTTGRFLAEPHCASLAVAMIKEMAAIAAARGIEIVDQSPLPVASIAGDAPAAARQRVTAIGTEWLESAAGHRMSSLQDLERGKRLEVEETLGFAIREGLRLGLATPTLAVCYELLTGINNG
ncbi:MAG: 2-dehydropantoate 2-reductase [Gammaproteobacteria bacterium]|nr:2-dehydropantoate 2-reductase [Gammaproteobacteria bacterium]